MNQVGFDSEKYIRLQSEHIRERINQFGGKLYLEFGGKLFDDYHAARVLPGFAPELQGVYIQEHDGRKQVWCYVIAESEKQSALLKGETV